MSDRKTIPDETDLVSQIRAVRQLLSESGYDNLADGVGRYLDDLDNGAPGASLDRCLGLRRRGGLSPARAAALEHRDGLIAQLWKSSEGWRDLPPSAAARVMRISVERYERARWPREQKALVCPLVEPAATWWRILRSGLPVPDVKRLKKILSDAPTTKSERETND